ncbi:hydroxybutyrate-dimer hydrolase [Amphiplicatus metriothermophilus]|uniref:Hydroxybutyrate-dimer hydrolase n=2 Tax=Amphiplicatus metriothermophilus TaxID=1519374 RepID=A0A239PQ49_9PROT|nr:hydroxybutyrate-dimer hydrolase [Amphiplicatus metriothermophilus]
MREVFGALGASLMAACAGEAPEMATAPALSLGSVALERPPAYFDGVADDLLTGGLGLEGLNAAAPPADASLRSKAIHYNFRAIIDVTEAGGFTRLYGPAKDRLKVAGTEYRALLRVDGMKTSFAVAVLIPDDFDADDPCLIVAPSSGSRGLYGAIGTGGAIGLARGCAVALTDKTTGTGYVHLETGEGYDVDLALTDDPAEMLYALDESERREAAAALGSGAIAVKHAHSGENVERFWGRATLAAAEYGLAVLDRHFADRKMTRENTRVLAVSISNGGRAALMAAEADETGLLDGVVVSEPSVAPASPGRVVVDGAEIEGAGRPLYDYASFANLLAPCAALAPSLADEPGATFSASAAPAFAGWCAKLAEAGLVEGATVERQAERALAALRAYGFAPDTDPLFHYSVAVRIWPAVTVAYANAYGRYGAGDALCGAYYAFADADGTQRAPTQEEKQALAARSGGVPPGAGVEILYRDGPAAAFDAAMCFRRLWTESESRVREGVNEVLNTADLRAVPTIILHGRADALIPVDHASRAYVAAARSNAALRYYEIERGQHFDAFLTAPEMAARFAPMQYYLEKSVDLMLDHLRAGAKLPPSQVVRQTSRGPGPLGAEHLGAIRAEPDGDAIEKEEGAIAVPR